MPILNEDAFKAQQLRATVGRKMVREMGRSRLMAPGFTPTSGPGAGFPGYTPRPPVQIPPFPLTNSPGGTVPAPTAGGGFDPCRLLGPPESIQYQLCAGVGGMIPVPGNPYAPQEPNGGGGGGGGVSPCPTGYIKVGDRCVSPGDAFPGGDPFTVPAGGGAVQGAFGLPAIQPAVRQQRRLDCPEGMVLGKDNLCYPKQILGRRSKYRKWKGDRKPKVSAREWSQLQKANRTKEKVKEVAKEAGFSCKRR